MQSLMIEHWEFVQASFVGLIGLIVYLYKQNESNSARLIANKLDAIVTQLDKLFRRDELKTEAIAELSERVVKQEQRCDDRAASCPGKYARKDLARHLNKGDENG